VDAFLLLRSPRDRIVTHRFFTMLSSSLVRHAVRRTAGPAVGAVRNLNVHEYISMEIMNKYQIATPKGYVASTPEEAESICAQHFQQGT
jgi:acyl-CoA synthetase (NDP forming)